MSGVLTIKRSEWRRGGAGADKHLGRTELLNQNGLMCCLGFDALACGVDKDELLGMVSPIGLWFHGVKLSSEYMHSRLKPSLFSSGRFDHAEAVQEAISHNDDPLLTHDQRELLVRDALLKLGWDDVVFVD